ncbi:MAG: NADH-quinone oxidoreductase subunit N [Gaiellaceae bacterium]
MIKTPPIDWLTLAPSLALVAATIISLLTAVLVPERFRKRVAWAVCVIGYGSAFAAAALLYDRGGHARSVVANSLFRDRYGALAAMVVAGSGLLTALVFWGERAAPDRVGERFALLAAAGGGMIFFAQAANLLTLFLGLEWFSISLYVLCALERERPEAVEAGFKYLIVGGFSSAILVFGSALVYGATGTLNFTQIAGKVAGGNLLLVTGLALILAGFAFKASAAPFHMWTPDVYQGASTPVSGFMAGATKAVALVVALRLLVVSFPAQEHLWTAAAAVLAVASLAVGNLAALAQRDLKRMLAYSSISHAGFLLLAVTAANPLGDRALLFYLIPYSAASIGSFAIVAVRERDLGEATTLENLAGFGWERPLLGIALWIFMLSFAGFPLTGGFVGKVYVFSAAYEAGWTWLLIVAAVATVVSLGYYLAVVRAIYMHPRPDRFEPPPPERLLSTAVLLAVVVTVGSFFATQPLIDLAKHAASQLPL